MRNMLSLLIPCLVALATPSVHADGQSGPRDETAVLTDQRTIYHDVDLELTGALFRDDTPPADPRQRKDLMLYLGHDAKAGFRPRFIAWAGMRRDHGPLDDKQRRYSQIDHEGQITSQAATGQGEVELNVDITIHPDPWVPGGKAQFTLRLKRVGDRFVGTYSGTFKGKKITGPAEGELAKAPWPSPVKDWQPLEPGEHPRLMFRKSDLDAIRKRAQTPEGKLIVRRIRYLLGGGERFPDAHNTAKRAYGGGKRIGVGGYTIAHGAGYGMLYQLTGDKKYAALARQAVELSFKGVRDADQRYSWHNPGGKLRAGPSYAQIAYAYDLCYDAWDKDFREKVAKALQEKVFNPKAGRGEKAMAEPTGGDLIFNTQGGQHSPHSNHYGAWNGGGGVAILAILGDPGTDDAVTYRAHRVLMQRAERALEVGYGDSGWFFEGTHGGRLNFNTGLAEYLHCLRNAAGLDLIANFPGGDWMTTKWLYELTRQKNRIVSVHRGIYAGHGFSQGPWSAGGDFSIGFSHVPQRHQPAVKWFYQHVIDPNPIDNSRFDSFRLPTRAVYALLNWPIGVEPVNPDEILPRYLIDPKADYLLFRSGWCEDGNDWLVANHYDAYVRGPGLNTRTGLRAFRGITNVEDKLDGKACVVTCERYTLVADMSGRSGAPILLVAIPNEAIAPENDGKDAQPEKPTGFTPPFATRRFAGQSKNTKGTKPRVTEQVLDVAGQDWRVYTIQSGELPETTVGKNKSKPSVQIGGRVITLDKAAFILSASDS